MKKKKTTKTPNPNTESKTQTKIQYPVEFLDIFTLRQKPTHPATIEAFFVNMPTWALKDPEAFKISQYRIMHGVCQDTLEKWKALDPRYQKAYDETKTILGNKREIGWIKKNFETTAIRLSMRNYDPEWIALTTPEEETKQNITVVIPPIEKTNKVPEKHDKKNKDNA